MCAHALIFSRWGRLNQEDLEQIDSHKAETQASDQSSWRQAAAQCPNVPFCTGGTK